MKILFAADGSKFTKKALAFLVAHPAFTGPETEIVVVNVQSAIPPHISRMLDHGEVASYQREESEKVLKPITEFLTRRGIACRGEARVGSPVVEIVKAGKKAKADLVVMGTHGHGVVARALMGSIAQRVVADGELPVLLVK